MRGLLTEQRRGALASTKEVQNSFSTALLPEYFNHSIGPLDCGWYGVVKFVWVPALSSRSLSSWLLIWWAHQWQAIWFIQTWPTSQSISIGLQWCPDRWWWPRLRSESQVVNVSDNIKFLILCLWEETDDVKRPLLKLKRDGHNNNWLWWCWELACFSHVKHCLNFPGHYGPAKAARSWEGGTPLGCAP